MLKIYYLLYVYNIYITFLHNLKCSAWDRLLVKYKHF